MTFVLTRARLPRIPRKRELPPAVLNLQISAEMKDALAKLAKRDGQTSSSLVRQLLADHLRSKGFLK